MTKKKEPFYLYRLTFIDGKEDTFEATDEFVSSRLDFLQDTSNSSGREPHRFTMTIPLGVNFYARMDQIRSIKKISYGAK